MSRLPASALEEGDQIHAILRPLLAEVGAAKRRVTAMSAKPDPRAFAFGELDQVIDALLARMRIDPRPTKLKTQTREAAKPATREMQRPGREDTPPTADVQRAAQEAAALRRPTQTGQRPATKEVARPAQAGQRPTSTRELARPTPAIMPELPPPVPTAKTRDPEPRQSFDENPPPVPTGPGKSKASQAGAPGDSATTRNLQRPTPPIPVAAPPPPKKAPVPVYGPDAATGPIVLARPGTAPETFLLYDDIVMLSAMNDRDGLLISLERLMVLARLEDHVRVFIDANEQKLVGLYEAQLKSFSRVPLKKEPAVDNTMPRVFLRGEKVAAVLQHIDGKATIADIVQKTNLSRIETLSVLAQLQRSGILDI